jgi:hypothetical protein
MGGALVSGANWSSALGVIRHLPASPLSPPQALMSLLPASPHSQKLYRDSLRKEAGFVKVVVSKNARDVMPPS